MADYKIVLVGPKHSGKTTVANFLAAGNAEPTALDESPYMETAGTRILEFDLDLGRRSCSVEMWDCSGDIKYENCWPAIMQGADGIILMYNPENATQSGEVEQWYHWFVTKSNLKDTQCLVMANDCRNGHDDPNTPPPRSLRNALFVKVDANGKHEIRSAFQDFVDQLPMGTGHEKK